MHHPQKHSQYCAQIWISLENIPSGVLWLFYLTQSSEKEEGKEISYLKDITNTIKFCGQYHWCLRLWFQANKQNLCQEFKTALLNKMTTRNFEKFSHIPRDLKQCTFISLCVCSGNTWKNRKPHTSIAYVEVLRPCVSRKWKLKCIVNFLKLKAYFPTHLFFFFWQKVKEIKVGYFRKPSD